MKLSQIFLYFYINFTKIFLYFYIIFTIGCAGFLPQLQKDIHYQRDIRMEIKYYKDGDWKGPLKINGMGVMYNAAHYKIKVTPPGKADMITVTSCHRELKTPNPKRSGGWFSKGSYEFSIALIDSVDAEELCSFDIGIYEKKKGRHGWGMIAIEDPAKFKLKALAKCNGRVKQYDGVSVCQAKKGLIQEYVFDRPVSYAKVVGCELGNLSTANKYAKKWKFIMPEGECEIFFMDIKDPLNMIHQAFFYGYDTIPIRGVR